jgi:hypothetical protein
VIDDLVMGARFARDIGAFLRRPMSLDMARRRLAEHLQNRVAAFLHVVERGVFGHAASPYHSLIQRAGISFRDIEGWARQDGVEAALGRMYEAGIHVTIDELKGRGFDNPLMTRHFEAQSGGSTGSPKRVVIDLDLHTHETAYDLLFMDAFDLLDRPMALWRPAPPGIAGINLALRRSKLDRPAERWFSQTAVMLRGEDVRFRLFLWFTVYASRVLGRPLPTPEFVPLSDARRVAGWLADKKAEGRPAVLDTNVSSGVRVCLAAQQDGLDIAGSLFRFGSEPYTEARARIVAATGCRAVCHYFMSEIARIGSACAAPAAIDDVHVLTDKLAVIQRPRRTRAGDTVGALYVCTLHHAVPKLMLNVEVGDYGVLDERDCGCPLGRLGFRLHLHSIRSFEKLTSDGMNFLATELLALVEDILPATFGGDASDYQLVEAEENGLARINLVIGPRVGAVDESRAVETALTALGAADVGKRMMADAWRQGATMRVVRREPYATPAGKVPPLFALRAAAQRGTESRVER